MGSTTTTLYELSSQEPAGLSCSLKVTLSPWCMITNSTGCLIKLTNLSSKEENLIEANEILVPSHIQVSFEDKNMKGGDKNWFYLLLLFT